MPMDIPRERGWYIPKDACGDLMEETDVLEEKLYKAHDHANRVGTQLTRSQKDVMIEYERTGKVGGLSFEEWLGRSRSIVAEVFKEKQKMMGITMGNVITALEECDEAKAEIEKDVHALKLEFADAAMHCRRISQHEFEDLDVRVQAEVPASEKGAIVIPIHHVSGLTVGRQAAEYGHLRTLIDQGCHTFVGISCPVDAVTLSNCITLKQNPCMLPRLGLKDERAGRCLKTMFLADNRLGPHGLNTIAKGMQCNGQLEVLHCIENDVGEVGKENVGEDRELAASLSALEGIAMALTTQGCLLRVLNLSGNNIGPAGAACIAKGLATSPQLELLDLSNNLLGVAGANHIAVALTQNTALQVLNLNATQIARAGLRAILSALAHNDTLSVLFALGTVGPSALSEVDKFLKDNSTLREVHLFDATPWMNPAFEPNPSGQDSGAWDTEDGNSARGRRSDRPRVEWRAVANENFRLEFFFEDPIAPKKVEQHVPSQKELALQLERQQNRLEKARRGVVGIANETAVERINKRGLGMKEVVQHWGPPLKLGVNMPTAAQVIGYYAGGVDKASVRCEWCAAEKWKAVVGEFGHEAYECPRRFYEETGEVMPGFTDVGDREEELWNAAFTETVDAVQDMFADLRRKGFFLESGNPPPQDVRMKPLPDYAANGVARKPWSERGAYRSIDAVKRRQLYHSRSDPFAGGAAVLNQFLQSRHKEHEEIRQHSRLADRFMSTKGFIPGIKDRMLKFIQKVRHNHVDDVKDFLDGKYGKVDVDGTDMEGNTPLVVAAQNGHKRVLRMLFKAGAHLDQQDHKGNTALHFACAFKNKAMTTYLISKGADDTITNVKGQTCYEGLA